jgi:hypothetical protein
MILHKLTEKEGGRPITTTQAHPAHATSLLLHPLHTLSTASTLAGVFLDSTKTTTEHKKIFVEVNQNNSKEKSPSYLIMEISKKDQLIIFDTTLRDGEQVSYVYLFLDAHEKLTLSCHFSTINVVPWRDLEC